MVGFGGDCKKFAKGVIGLFEKDLILRRAQDDSVLDMSQRVWHVRPGRSLEPVEVLRDLRRSGFWATKDQKTMMKKSGSRPEWWGLRRGGLRGVTVLSKTSQSQRSPIAITGHRSRIPP